MLQHKVVFCSEDTSDGNVSSVGMFWAYFNHKKPI